MNTISIGVKVDPASAVRAGKVRSGVFQVDLDEEFIASLSESERDELALALAPKEEPLGGGRTPGQSGTLQPDPRCVDASLEEVKTVLAFRSKHRTEHRMAKEERELAENAQTQRLIDALNVASEEKVQEMARLHFDSPNQVYGAVINNLWTTIPRSDERIAAFHERVRVASDVIATERQARRVAEDRKREEEVQKEIEAKRAFSAALSAWIEGHGSESQRARQAEGLLSENEALDTLRDFLFSTVALERYQKLAPRDIHEDFCEAGATFDVWDLSTLSEEQYAVLVAARESAPGIEFTPQVHVGKCDRCEGRVSRGSLKAQVEWHGRTLSRQFAFPDREDKTAE